MNTILITIMAAGLAFSSGLPRTSLAFALSCQYQPGGLPDPVCTPGAIDPRVTQDNIHETICVPGYTSRARWTADGTLLWPTHEGYDAGYAFTPRLRPTTAYTNRLKDQGLVDYGMASSLVQARTMRSLYEEDHFIPLELGGNPTDPANLWPEPWTGDANAHEKDVTENLCHAEVCAEHIALADAQAAIVEDWRTACR